MICGVAPCGARGSAGGCVAVARRKWRGLLTPHTCVALLACSACWHCQQDALWAGRELLLLAVGRVSPAEGMLCLEPGGKPFLEAVP